jgi:hypothetical protein
VKYLAHRGKWASVEEQNTHSALSRAIALGCGIETDVRDCMGQLVISHDPCSSECALTLNEVFQIEGVRSQLLALNIKSDGLAPLLKDVIEQARIADYFFFDMSVPQAVSYHKQGLKFFTRQSEFELQPSLYEQADGVWIDCFEKEWLDRGTLSGHFKKGKRVALVSPELHGRDPLAFWQWLKTQNVAERDDLALCTDRPEEAQAFFNGSK